MNTGEFWRKDPAYRLARIRDAFAVYFELLAYQPIQWAIDELGKVRPPNEQMISGDLFRCIRHILQHLPLFDSWEDIHFTKDLINWQSDGKSIDRFFRAHENDAPIKFRVYTSNAMWYLAITLPAQYSKGGEVWLKEIIPEILGIKFCLAFMKRILDTQVEAIGQPVVPDAPPPISEPPQSPHPEQAPRRS